MLTEARRALESMRHGGSAETSPDAEGVGEASEGRIKVIAVAPGRIADVTIDPRAMRMGSQELGEQLAVAVNAALEDLRAKSAEAGVGEPVDLAALNRQMEDVQNQGLRQMELIRQAINDTVAQIQEGR